MSEEVKNKIKSRMNEILGLMITKSDELRRLESEKKGLQFALDAMDGENVAN